MEMHKVFFKGSTAAEGKGEESPLLLGRERNRYVSQRVGGAVGDERPRSRVRCGKGEAIAPRNGYKLIE